MNPLRPPTEPAMQRLRLSRERLRVALQGDEEAPRVRAPAAAPGAPAEPGSAGTAARDGLALAALQLWWRRHPLHAAGDAADAVATAALRPVALRHPVGLVLAAALVGGLVAVTRPWRWLPMKSLLAAWLPLLLGAKKR
jgi:hypothetical protein